MQNRCSWACLKELVGYSLNLLDIMTSILWASLPGDQPWLHALCTITGNESIKPRLEVLELPLQNKFNWL